MVFPKFLSEESIHRTMRIPERRGGKAVVETLPENVIERRLQMARPYHFQRKTLSLSQTSPSGILRVEVSGIGIPFPPDQFSGVVGLHQLVIVCGHKPLAKQPGLCFHNSQCQAVEPHIEVRLAAIHYFLM